jgi:hypothetical protein
VASSPVASPTPVVVSPSPSPSPSPAPSPPPSDDSGSSTSAPIGVIVGVGVPVLLIVILLSLIAIRRKRNAVQSPDRYELGQRDAARQLRDASEQANPLFDPTAVGAPPVARHASLEGMSTDGTTTEMSDAAWALHQAHMRHLGSVSLYEVPVSKTASATQEVYLAPFIFDPRTGISREDQLKSYFGGHNYQYMVHGKAQAPSPFVTAVVSTPTDADPNAVRVFQIPLPGVQGNAIPEIDDLIPEQAQYSDLAPNHRLYEGRVTFYVPRRGAHPRKMGQESVIYGGGNMQYGSVPTAADADDFYADASAREKGCSKPQPGYALFGKGTSANPRGSTSSYQGEYVANPGIPDGDELHYAVPMNDRGGASRALTFASSRPAVGPREGQFGDMPTAAQLRGHLSLKPGQTPGDLYAAASQLTRHQGGRNVTPGTPVDPSARPAGLVSLQQVLVAHPIPAWDEDSVLIVGAPQVPYEVPQAALSDAEMYGFGGLNTAQRQAANARGTTATSRRQGPPPAPPATGESRPTVATHVAPLTDADGAGEDVVDPVYT